MASSRRPPAVGLALPSLAALPEGDGAGKTGNRDPVCGELLTLGKISNWPHTGSAKQILHYQRKKPTQEQTRYDVGDGIHIRSFGIWQAGVKRTALPQGGEKYAC